MSNAIPAASSTAAPLESFAALFEESLTRKEMRTGEVITAEVIRVEHNFVVVNAGLKSEAYVPIEEFKNDIGELEVQPGDFVSVAIDAVENGYGDTILSRDKAKRLASWLSLETADAVLADLVRMTNPERAAIPVMAPGRGDVIIAGALILTSVMRRFGFERALVSETDILDALAYELLDIR